MALGRLFADRVGPTGRPVSDEECARDTAGFREILERSSRHGLPIMLVGNGIATDDDDQRRTYLLDHLSVIHRCLQDGLDIRGYFHRAFLDGFEWTHGYSARYGLVHVARDTLARTPNPSAYLYKDICDTGAVRRGTVARFCPAWHLDGEHEAH